MAANEVLYAAYGEMERVLPVLLDRRLESGISVVLHDVQLCVQDISEVTDKVAAGAPAPISPQQILAETWGEAFSAYAARFAPRAQTPARLHKISSEEQEIIEDYNLNAFGWFKALRVAVTPIDVKRKPAVPVIADVLSADQAATPVPTRGYIVQPPLNDGKRTLEVARSVREEFLARAA